MITRSILEDLYRHMEWADSVVWKAVPGLNDPDPDSDLHDRLAHVHVVQAAFDNVWSGEPLVRKKASDFETLADIRDYARTFYHKIPGTLDDLTDEKLAQPMPLPWASYFERTLGRAIQVTTRAETLMQVAMHTQYHRGQVNMRLRQLGVTPPLVDYIAWLWSGRPAPVW
jgi:uncharacterized damage-inducible protein DinB